MILGCSNLTGRFWIGSLWYYRDPSEAPSVEKALTGVDFANGIVDGFFLDDKNVSIILFYALFPYYNTYTPLLRPTRLVISEIFPSHM